MVIVPGKMEFANLAMDLALLIVGNIVQHLVKNVHLTSAINPQYIMELDGAMGIVVGSMEVALDVMGDPVITIVVTIEHHLVKSVL